MPNDKDLLNKRKQTLLTELESIKGLLDSDPVDNIPLLQDAIIEEEAERLVEPPLVILEDDTDEVEAVEAFFEPEEDTPTSTLINGALPGQQSLFNEQSKAKLKEKNKPHATGSHASLSQNPFLPAHVRQRFGSATKEAAPISEDIKPPPNTNEASINNSYTERLVDQLVAHHLPKIEAELRERLLAVVKLHNERLKK
jgi:hypothetical protein